MNGRTIYWSTIDEASDFPSEDIVVEMRGGSVIRMTTRPGALQSGDEWEMTGLLACDKPYGQIRAPRWAKPLA